MWLFGREAIPRFPRLRQRRFSLRNRLYSNEYVTDGSLELSAAQQYSYTMENQEMGEELAEIDFVLDYFAGLDGRGFSSGQSLLLVVVSILSVLSMVVGLWMLFSG